MSELNNALGMHLEFIVYLSHYFYKMCTVQMYNLDSKSDKHWLTKVNTVTLHIAAQAMC